MPTGVAIGFGKRVINQNDAYIRLLLGVFKVCVYSDLRAALRVSSFAYILSLNTIRVVPGR